MKLDASVIAVSLLIFSSHLKDKEKQILMRVRDGWQHRRDVLAHKGEMPVGTQATQISSTSSYWGHPPEGAAQPRGEAAHLG